MAPCPRLIRNGLSSSRCQILLQVTLILLAVSLTSAAYGPPAEAWVKRSVLQVLTDRFAQSDCPSTPRRCKDLMNACGGTHVGLRQHLDYIKVQLWQRINEMAQIIPHSALITADSIGIAVPTLNLACYPLRLFPPWRHAEHGL